MHRLQDTASMKQSLRSAFVAIVLLAPAGFAMAQVSGTTTLGITEVELKDVINGVSAKRHVNPVGGGRLLQLSASGTAVIAQMSVDVATSLPTLRQLAAVQ